MSALRTAFCSAAALAVFVAIGCGAANAEPLTYTLSYTEDDGNGASTGTGQFTIDSSEFSAGPAAYFLPSNVSNFSATFTDVGPSNDTDTYSQSDLASIDVETDAANSPPFDWVYFTTTDTSVYIPCCTFADGNDYMFGNADLGAQTITNDTTGTFVIYSYTIAGPAAPVPEPGSLALLTIGAAGLPMLRRRRRT